MDTHLDSGPAGGAADQLESLYAEMVDVVYSYAAARVGRSDGEELAGDVFCAAAKAYRDGRGSEVTPAWIMAVARNKVIDRWRSSARRSAKSHLLRPGRNEVIVGPDAWTADDRREFVVDALDSLDEMSRLLLVLRYLEGYPVPDIARRIRRSTKATASALARARRKLRAAYEGGTSDER